MRFEVLGPVRAVDDARALGPVSDLRRLLLAVMLARANRMVPADLLAEVMWGDAPPERPAKSLQIHIHRLRHVLDRPDRLTGVPGGYVLEVGKGEFDAAEFEALHAEARLARERGDLDASVAAARAGLELWRGAPYADVDDGLVVGPEARRLSESRLIATEELYEAELARGRAREVVPELTELVSEFPLRERFVAQLMVALYRSGRQARALTAFRAVRQRLGRELGAEPGRELRELNDAIIAEDPSLVAPEPGRTTPQAAPVSPAVAPAQLPPAPGAFVGRDAELAALDEIVGSAEAAATVVITGMAGAGKTSLAVKYAHGVADRFGDGQLYIDLRGHSAAPSLKPAEALGQLIRGLGADPGPVADSIEAATAQFRSLVSGRKILLVLDNVASAEQVRPLLPATSGCLTVITSRNRLPGLVAREGARRLVVDVLHRSGSHALLAELLGDARVEAEPEPVDALIDECADLPLALRIAAAQLADEPHRSIGDYLAELRDRGLEVLALEDDKRSAVAAAFDLSYQRLDADTRRAFRLLGTVPGVDVTIDAVAAITEVPAAETRATVRRLVGAHLLDEHAAGRYRLHDLLRDYAGDRADSEDTTDARTAALERLFSWYYTGTEAAWDLLKSHLRQPPRPDVVGDLPAFEFADRRDAVEWLTVEFANIAAAARMAADTPALTPWSWHLVLGASIPMARRGFLADELGLLRTAVAAARTAGDRHALAHTLTEYGSVQTLAGIVVPDELIAEVLEHAESVGDRAVQAYCLYMASVVKMRSNQFGVAEELLHRTLALQREVGDVAGTSLSLNYLGGIALFRGDLRLALGWWEQILDLEASEGLVDSRSAVINTASTRVMLGELDGIEALLRRADELIAKSGDKAAECVHRLTRAEWHRVVGRLDDAFAEILVAEQLADSLGIARLQTDTRTDLGFCHLALGDLETARREFVRSAEIARGSGLLAEGSEAIRGLADAWLAAGDHEAAAVQAKAALDLAGQEHRIYRGEALTTLAAAELAAGKVAEAIAHAEDAESIQRATEHYLGLARALRVLGEALLVDNDAERKARGIAQLENALHMYEKVGSPEASIVRAVLDRQ